MKILNVVVYATQRVLCLAGFHDPIPTKTMDRPGPEMLCEARCFTCGAKCMTVFDGSD